MTDLNALDSIALLKTINNPSLPKQFKEDVVAFVINKSKVGTEPVFNEINDLLCDIIGAHRVAIDLLKSEISKQAYKTMPQVNNQNPLAFDCERENEMLAQWGLRDDWRYKK